MYVVKRNGQHEPVHFDKIATRIERLCNELDKNYIDVIKISQKVIQGLYNGVSTEELDILAAETAASFSTVHFDYGKLAGRIAVSNLHKNTEPSFSKNILKMRNYINPKNEEHAPLISDYINDVIQENAEILDKAIDYTRDYDFDYFGFKTLEKSYLLKMNGKVSERPQQLFMRVAVGIHTKNVNLNRKNEFSFESDDIYLSDDSCKNTMPVLDVKAAIETYNLMSQRYFIHATPTLYNSGTPRPQLSSCFLLGMEDSVEGIYDSLKKCAMISKYAGGIGIWAHDIRASDSYIKGTNGISNGIVPMLRVFNDTARYIDQCFTPETLIITNNGHKQIQHVSTDDKVLSSDSQFRQVNKLVEHDYNGKMLKIQIKNSTYPVQTTPEHQIFALQGQKKGLNFSLIKNRLEKGLAKPEFVDAKDLQVGDFLIYSIPTYEKDIPDFTEDDCRFYGILLGDGHISKKTSGVSGNNTTKIEMVNFVKNYLENKNITYCEKFDNHTHVIVWTTSMLESKFTKKDLYDEQKIKKFNPDYLHLPINKILKILQGLIESDGCVGEKEIAIRLSSQNLIESIKYMMLRLGAPCSGYVRDDVGKVSTYKNITTKLISYVLRITRVPEIMKLFPHAPESKFYTFMRHENYIYSRIESIEDIDYTGKVYDFEIESPHDYTVSHLGIVHNGGGRRKGSFAVYLEPWHADIFDFLDLKKNSGKEEMRARDLFYGLWVPDLFMKRVEENGSWTLFCPNEAPGLSDVYGNIFEDLYIKYEREGRGRKTIKAQQLWFAILQSQIETGTPYLLYKDAVNNKSNQQNLGTIKSSNLCVAPETLILTDDGEFPIASLKDKEVNVWNGDCWSQTTIRQTGENQKLITVYLSNGASITCTPYHKFIMEDDNRVDAQTLIPGNVLQKFKLPNTIEPIQLIITGVVDNGRVDDTYCFNEPLNHAGIFNGVMTGQCTEVTEYTSSSEVAVCNLASIALNRYVEYHDSKPYFNFTKLYDVSKVITRNLNNVIDYGYYPVPEAEYSNKKHRPIGIGVQALFDTFAMMKYPFESEEAALLNKQIFAVIYYAALEASMELAMRDGPYETFIPSPASMGILQFDMWGVEPIESIENELMIMNLDWNQLKEKIITYGLRNSLLLAPMPTASTAQILGNNESIEPITSNMYLRRCLSGEYSIVNKHLLKELIERGLWNSKTRTQIMMNNGSIQNIPEIPDDLKELFKTVWEIKQKTLIDMAADRGAYICQSQSLNLFISEPNNSKLTSMHFYAWKKGLKTGIYYLRSKPKANAIQFTVDKSLLDKEAVDDFRVGDITHSDKLRIITVGNNPDGVRIDSDRVRIITYGNNPDGVRVSSIGTHSETPAEKAARERRELREKILSGQYEDNYDVCINCSS